MTKRGWLLFATVGIVWGMPYLLIRVAVREISPPTLVFFRTAPAALVLLPLAMRHGNLRQLVVRWRAVLAYTAAELGVSWLMLFRAEQRLSSSLSGLLIATVPFIALILGKLMHDPEPFGRTRLAGLFIGIAGVATLVGADVRGNALIAVGEIGITAMSYALGPRIVSGNLHGLPALDVVTASLVLTAIAYAPFALTHLPRQLDPEVVSSVVVLIIVCTAVAFVAFYALINEVGPVRATVVTYLNPAVAVILGVLILKEHFTIGVAVGFPLVLVGSYFATTSSELGHRRQRPSAPTQETEPTDAPARSAAPRT